MTNDQRQKEIDTLEAECATLKTKHEETVKQFQQIVQQNQNRYSFLQGSIAALQKEQGENNGNAGSITVAPISRPRGRPRRDRMAPVVE